MSAAPMKLVLVVWEDASEVDSGIWVDRATAPEPEMVIFHQVGFVERLTARELVLVHCVGAHQMSPRNRIPAGMIRSIVELDPEGTPLTVPRARKTK
jgi:hypothetical protein